MIPSEALNGNPSVVACDRALTELRHGRVIAMRQTSQAIPLLAAALETADAALISRLRHCSTAPLVLALTAQRALALGLPTSDGAPLLLQLDATLTAESIASLALDWTLGHWQKVLTGSQALTAAADACSSAALRLIKQTQLLPVVLLATPATLADGHDLLQLTLADVERHGALQLTDLQRVSEARVPLRDCEDSRLVLFRDRRNGSEHIAVWVGRPDLTQPIPLRLHSACLTGDLLGSLRCDCGEQLNTGVQRLAEAGGGLLLYLAQEGRGIGLANKLRAYQLQDGGLDTIDADQQLGFRSDERTYDVAAALLRQLDITAVNLLTNSPHKVRELRAAGITVSEIGALPGTPNPHNARYIRTKQDRAGHSRPVEHEQT